MKKLTEEERLEVGGHCWNYHSANTPNTSEDVWKHLILSQGECLYKLTLLVLERAKSEERRMKYLTVLLGVLLGVMILGLL